MGDGVLYNVGIGSISCAGVDPKQMQMNTMTYESMHPGCYDPKARIEVQDRDGRSIPGLYAAGACAWNIAQDTRSYSSGTCLGESTYFGRRAGRHAARR